jgi:predicted amidohydrolase YtcJ
MILRGAIYPILEYPKEIEGALKLESFNGPFMRLGGFKLQIDGQATTAYCHEPHDGITWDKPHWEPEAFKKTVSTLHDAGYQICVHAVGDARVDLVLDTYEAAMNANPRPDPRHRIEHCGPHHT